jgi:protein-S-isoprenylcysteine O-methyltransferase Ste14
MDAGLLAGVDLFARLRRRGDADYSLFMENDRALLDRRFAWSRVPLALVILGDALVALGFFIIFLIFKENTYSAGTIEVAAGQEVISIGPYARVRHPKYSGALIMLFGTRSRSDHGGVS